jgi:hypothetical protein
MSRRGSAIPIALEATVIAYIRAPSESRADWAGQVDIHCRRCSRRGVPRTRPAAGYNLDYADALDAFERAKADDPGLELDPRRKDAGLVVGLYSYAVADLSEPLWMNIGWLAASAGKTTILTAWRTWKPLRVASLWTQASILPMSREVLASSFDADIRHLAYSWDPSDPRSEEARRLALFDFIYQTYKASAWIPQSLFDSNIVTQAVVGKSRP